MSIYSGKQKSNEQILWINQLYGDTGMEVPVHSVAYWNVESVLHQDYEGLKLSGEAINIHLQHYFCKTILWQANSFYNKVPLPHLCHLKKFRRLIRGF